VRFNTDAKDPELNDLMNTLSYKCFSNKRNRATLSKISHPLLAEVRKCPIGTKLAISLPTDNV
jgi:hypothetical protein